MSDLLKELEETIKGCSRCGFCMVECPTYGATKIEWDAARGRVRMANQLVNGKMILNEELDDPVDTCLRCGSCKEVCSSQIDTPKAVQLMRTMRYQAGKLKLPYKMIFTHVIPYPKRMATGARLMGTFQRVVGDKWTNRKIIARSFPSARMIPNLPQKSARRQLRDNYEAIGPKRGKVIYFLGCATDLVYPETALTTVRLLQSQGIEVFIPKTSCCGLPAFTYGHIDSALSVAKANLEILNCQEFDAVISDCPTCLSFLKEYRDLPLDDICKEKALVLSGKIISLTDYFAKIGLLEPKRELKKTVTYHQPCHVGRYPGAAKSVEAILETLPGITFKKSANQNICCGGAGSYCFTQFDRSQIILKNKLDGMFKENPDSIVTNCPACMMQLEAGLKLTDSSIELINLVDLMGKIFI